MYGKRKTSHGVEKSSPERTKSYFAYQIQKLLNLGKSMMELRIIIRARNKKWTPMDVEWAKDGDDGTLYIVQARPETCIAQENNRRIVNEICS